ncbi:molybdenum cofactor guanylyltransferase [Hyphococcus sp.]|uniref:molybdenum cofactor guanylyltransferase n=1 Tax=Hyphococcus sp. TaxID=2038636 RepID=UPI003CCBE2A5
MTAKKPRYGLIFAGGGARRMGGAEKAALMLGGRRLIDIVIARLAPQCDQILIAGPDDYETRCQNLPDRDDGPAGPAAGLWSALVWLQQNAPDTDGIVTAPVDGPFFPGDLFEKLHAADCSAVARDDAGTHPTSAWWRCDDLRKVFKTSTPGEGLALKTLANRAAAMEIVFPGGELFRNINTPEDLARAEKDLRRV